MKECQWLKSRRNRFLGLLIIELLFVCGVFLLHSPKGNDLYNESKSTGLSAGTYTIEVSYIAKEDGAQYIITAPGSEHNDLGCDTTIDLEKGKSFISQDIYVNRNIDELKVELVTNDTDTTIQKIEVYENWNRVGTLIVKSILIFSMLAIVSCSYWFEKIWKDDNERKIFLLLLGIIFISCIPLMTNYLTLYIGHDLEYHLIRIEGLKEGLLAGQFPVRVYPFSNNGYGHMLSVFYPDLFLYFPAILRIVGFSVMDAYKMYLVLMNIITVFVSYYCFKRMFRNSWIGFMGTMLYVLSAYRFVDFYLRHAVGEGAAMTFLPIVLVGIYELLFTEKESANYKKVWILPIIGFTGLLHTHVLSFAMCIVYTFVVCICFFKRFILEKRFLMLIKSTIVTIVLNLSWLVPFLTLYGKYAHTEEMSIGSLQQHGLYWAQIFSSFFNMNGESYSVAWGIPGRMPLNIGLPLVIGILLFFVFYKDNIGNESKKYRRIGTFFVGIGFFTLYMTTYYFPWNPIGRLDPIINKMIGVIQFPWRFLAPATLFFVVVTCVAMLFAMANNENRRKVFVACMSVVVLISVSFSSVSIIQEAATWRVYDGVVLDDFQAYGNSVEWIPEETDTILFKDMQTIVAESEITVSDFEKNGTNISLHIENSSDEEKLVELPLLNYTGYRAITDDNKKLEIVNGENNRLGVMIEAGYKGNVKISYQGLWYFKVADFITLTTIILLILFSVTNRKSLMKKEKKENMLV